MGFKRVQEGVEKTTPSVYSGTQLEIDQKPQTVYQMKSLKVKFECGKHDSVVVRVSDSRSKGCGIGTPLVPYYVLDQDTLTPR